MQKYFIYGLGMHLAICKKYFKHIIVLLFLVELVAFGIQLN
jgi:hypothetical protein